MWVFFLIDIKYLLALYERNFEEGTESTTRDEEFVQTTIRKAIEHLVNQLSLLLSQIQVGGLIHIFVLLFSCIESVAHFDLSSIINMIDIFCNNVKRIILRILILQRWFGNTINVARIKHSGKELLEFGHEALTSEFEDVLNSLMLRLRKTLDEETYSL